MSNENTPQGACHRPAVGGPVERMVRPLCYMAKEVAAKLKAKAPEVAPNYGATTTVTIAMAFKDDAPLYDQAALNAAVAAERERWTNRLTEHMRRYDAAADEPHDVAERRLLRAKAAALAVALEGPNVCNTAHHCAYSDTGAKR